MGAGPSEPESPVRGAAYVCGPDNTRVEVAYEPGGAWVFLPGRTARLEQERAASGARYAGQGVVWWNKGRSAMLETGASRLNCEASEASTPWVDAKLRGADFRAIGNEPGWHLEIHGEQGITLVTDYGKRTLRFPVAHPRETENRTVYRTATESHTLVVELRPGPCFDDMSGWEYPTRVTVTLDGQTWQGCGRALH